MKKVISIALVLAMALSFTACGKAEKYVKLAKENGYISVFNTSWGMSVDECVKALELSKNDVEIADSSANKAVAIEQSFTTNKTFYDKSAKVTFMFDKLVKQDIDLGLYKVVVTFDEPIEKKVADEKTVDFLKNQNLKFTQSDALPFCKYSNEMTLEKLADKALSTKALDFKEKIYVGENQENLLIPKESSLDYVNYLLQITKGEDGEPIYGLVESISFNAGDAAFLAYQSFNK